MTGHKSSPEMRDGDLVDGVRAGNEEALSALYRRHVAAIYRFVLAQVRSVPDAEDLTSETFARMLHGIDGFRGEASFKNWLYQIARNAVRNHRRSAFYRRTLPLDGDLPERPAVEFETDPDSLEKVAAILRPLPPRYRHVLELRFIEGRTIRETARIMGITENNAKVLQHRALKKAAMLEEEPVEAGSEVSR